MTDNSETAEKSFDKLELMVAILLGLGAIGAALASYQSNMWGGKSTELYSEAATLSTRASTEHSYGVMAMAHDFNVEIQAQRAILEGLGATNETDRNRSFELASYLYSVQMNEEAFRALQLPMENRTGDREAQRNIPDEVLTATLDRDLDDNYIDTMLADGKRQFAEADAKFNQGRQASDNGDRFDFAGVIFAISLFFGGIALVFKTKIRWPLFFAGVGVFLAALVYMLTLSWA
jgi:hypothetical protein